MKIISLNIWGGREYEAFMSFIAKEAPTTDVFCFQEVYSAEADVPNLSHGTVLNIFEVLRRALPDFKGIFSPIQDGVDEGGEIPHKNSFGNAVFVKTGKEIETGFVFLCGNRNSMVSGDISTIPTGFQYLRIENNGTPLTICNTYGKAFPGTKLDTLERLNQSSELVKFVAGENGSVVACGDFNLLPETESVKIISAKLRNLIAEYDIKTTRSEINYKKYPPDEIQYFADYCFVSPDIKVKSFSVPQVEISDHLPMILEF